MKTKLLIIVLVCWIGAKGQEPDTLNYLKGGIGLEFGASRNNVIEILQYRGGSIDKSMSNDEMLVFDNIKIGGRKTIYISTWFVDNKLFEINVYFSPSLDPAVQQLFDEIKENLENKYGKSMCVRNFKGVYKDGDGYELQALRGGYADIVCWWNSFIDGNTIILKITTTLDVHINYQSDELTRMKIQKDKEKNLQEY